MKERFITVLILGLSTMGILKAQDTLTISRGELLIQMKEGNLQIQLAEKSLESARADYRQSNALFLPSITASHTAMLTTNPLMAFGSKLNQEVLTQADFNPSLLNDPTKIENYATQLEAMMPLINFDGLYERQAAKAKMEAYELQTGRTEEYMELEVIKAYMQLQLAYSSVKVLIKADRTARVNLQWVKDYFDQGMLQKTDLLDVQVRVNEVRNQVAYAKSNVRNASDYLALLMGQESGKMVYRPSEGIEEGIEPVVLVSDLPENRKDILAMNKSSEAYEKMLASSKMNFLPRLNAFGSYQMYDDHLLGFGAQGYMIGAQLSWTLFDGYKSIGKLEKSKVDFQRAQIEAKYYVAQSQLELHKTNRQLQDAENKVENAKLTLEQSREAYRIRNDRFQQGLMKTADLLLSEAQLFQKELEYLRALFEYHFTQNYLQFLTK